MSGDKLTLVSFAAAAALGAMTGAIATNGARARILWGLTLLFGLATLAALRAESGSPAQVMLKTAWTWSPFIGVAMALLVSGGRKPLEPKKLAPTPKPEPVLNPALTTAHFNSIVTSGTKLEAKRRFAALANQRAKVQGQVENMRESHRSIDVTMRGLRVPDADGYSRPSPMDFRSDQADALEVIKPGDWIEFTGQPEHCDVYGWTMTDCEFVARATPPPKPRAARSRRTT